MSDSYYNWITSMFCADTPNPNSQAPEGITAIKCMSQEEAYITYTRYTNEDLVW